MVALDSATLAVAGADLLAPSAVILDTKGVAVAAADLLAPAAATLDAGTVALAGADLSVLAPTAVALDGGSVALAGADLLPQAAGVLDPYLSGLAQACDYRRVVSTYTGPILRVQRTTPDSTQLDIGYNYDNSLDEVALAAFCGAGDGYLITRYDQSGSGLTANQVGSGGLPRLVIAGVIQKLNGKPCAKIVTGNDEYELNLAFTAYTGTTLSAVWAGQLGSQTAGDRLLSLTAGTQQDYNATTRAALIAIDAGGATPTLQFYNNNVKRIGGVPIPDGAAFAASWRGDGTTATIKTTLGNDSAAFTSAWGFNRIILGQLLAANTTERLNANSYVGSAYVWFAAVGATDLETIRAEAEAYWSGGAATVTLDAGTLAIAGDELAAPVAPTLDNGALAIAGVDLPASTAVTLDTKGALLAGADLVMPAAVTLDTKSITLAGADLLAPVSVLLDTKGMAVAGADLLAPTAVPLDTWNIAVAGADVTPLAAGTILLDLGNLAVAGADLNVLAPAVLTLDAGAVTVAGADLAVYPPVRVALDAGGAVVAGGDSQIVDSNGDSVIDANGDNVTAPGGGDILILTSVLLDTWNIAVAGVDLGVQAGATVVLDSGNAALAGTDVQAPVTVTLDVKNSLGRWCRHHAAGGRDEFAGFRRRCGRRHRSERSRPRDSHARRWRRYGRGRGSHCLPADTGHARCRRRRGCRRRCPGNDGGHAGQQGGRGCRCRPHGSGSRCGCARHRRGDGRGCRCQCPRAGSSHARQRRGCGCRRRSRGSGPGHPR